MPTLLRAKGLVTQPNQLAVQEGSLKEATNVVIQRDGIIEPRRGFKKYGTTMPLGGDRAQQLLVYKGRILRHFRDVLQFDNGSGTFSTFSGSYSEVEDDLRIKGIEANSNFYFTTSEGIKKISAPGAGSFSTASGYIKSAGVAQGLDITATVDYSQPGFFTPTSKVAYRVVFGIKDENKNLILGSPSVRDVVINYSETQSAVVTLTFSIPADVNTTDFFYQIYRTAVTQGTLSTIDDLEPGDEMNLVFEANLTATDISNGYITVTDVTPDDFRAGGDPLYTNPVTGEGILQSNDRPPIATDITLFNGSVFYSNTKTFHRLSISLLGLTDFLSGASKFIISNGTTTNEYTFVGTAEVTPITFDTKTNTTDGSYWLMNSSSNERKYVFWFDKTGTTTAPAGVDTNGRILIRINISAVGGATNVSPTVKTTIEASSASVDFSIVQTSAVKLTFTNNNNGDANDAVVGAVSPGGTFAIGTITQGSGENIPSQNVLLSGLSTPSQQVDDTTRSLVRVINRTLGEQVYATYLSGVDDVPGSILLERRTLTDNNFFIAVNNAALSDQFDPQLPVTHTITAITTGTTPTITTSASHGLAIGDTVILYGTNSTPSINGVYTVNTAPSLVDFTITVDPAVTIAGTAGFEFKGTTSSDNEIMPNRIYFSKYQQPEAVPLTNFIDVGARDKKNLRILALRDSLFILKENSVFRLTGPIAPNFSVSLLDSSVNFQAADSAAILNNLIYAVTNQDVITVSETGVSIISRPIEDEIVSVTAFPSFPTATFGVSYEKDRAYHLFTISSINDTVATQCLRYNSFTNSWVKWDVSKTSGIVNDFNHTLYLGAADENFIEIERKNLNRTDHADRESSLEIPANSVNGDIITLSSVETINIGDTIVQTQYLTIARFNRLLRKLDRDSGVGEDDYFSTLQMLPGDNLSNKISDLVSKLNADSNLTLTYTFTGSLDFATIQSEYNSSIIANLNSAFENTFYKNYQTSVGTFDFEATNLEVNLNDNTVTLLYSLALMQGPITLYKGIATSIIWAPQHFGDPSILKQVKEGTLIFEDNIFTVASISYSSDLSPSFDEITFQGKGLGDWGFFPWSQQNWGGEGSQVPLRTLIPAKKQRCRFLNPKFQHVNAREKYAIYGLSLDGRSLGDRAYK